MSGQTDPGARLLSEIRQAVNRCLGTRTLAPHEKEELTAVVALKLVEKERLQYTLAELTTIVRHAWIDVLRRDRERNHYPLEKALRVPDRRLPNVGAVLDLQSSLEGLSPRERQVAIWLEEGYSVREIAGKLGLTRQWTHKVCQRVVAHRKGKLV